MCNRLPGHDEELANHPAPLADELLHQLGSGHPDMRGRSDIKNAQHRKDRIAKISVADPDPVHFLPLDPGRVKCQDPVLYPR